MEERTKILIVDDEPINLDFFDVMLSKLGFIVEKAMDGEEALEKVRETNPDLVILDNIMPKLSGWKVTRLLKTHEDYKAYRDIPIIMFSAMDDVRDKIEGYELGVEDYIIKPFNFSEVLARIRAVLRHRALAKAMVRKEKRMASIQSLNESLIYFTKHLKKPVEDLIRDAAELNPEDSGAVAAFLDSVKDDSNEILAALNGLEEEIRDLEKVQAESESGEELLEDLESKFQKHFASIRERDEAVS